VVHSAKNGFVLDKVATRELPHDAIVEGVLMDSQVVKDTISDLLKESRLVGKDIALSVNGRHVMISGLTRMR